MPVKVYAQMRNSGAHKPQLVRTFEHRKPGARPNLPVGQCGGAIVLGRVPGWHMTLTTIFPAVCLQVRRLIDPYREVSGENSDSSKHMLNVSHLMSRVNEHFVSFLHVENVKDYTYDLETFKLLKFK